MVKDHVQEAFDAVVVEGPDQRFQLIALPVVFRFPSVAGVGSKEADRVIAPVIHTCFPSTMRLSFISSNSKIGISSTAVIPSSFRYGIFSMIPEKVPGQETPELTCFVNPRTCIS